MSVFEDVIARGYSFDSEQPVVGLSSTVVRELKGMDQFLNSPGYPAGFDVGNEVQSLSANESDDGTFTLTILGEETSALDHDIVFGDVQTAVDTALAGYPAYEAGDVVVAGGPADTSPLTFTFSGESVAGVNHALITVDGAALEFEEGAGTPGVVTQTTAGGSGRAAWAALVLAGVIKGTVPEQGANPVSVVAANGFQGSPHKLSSATVEALARQAAKVDDNPVVYTTLKELLGF